MTITRRNLPSLPLPPKEYEQTYMSRLIKTVQIALDVTNSTKQLRGSGDPTTDAKEPSPLNLANIPTSATGLKPGDVWSDGGTLKIV